MKAIEAKKLSESFISPEINITLKSIHTRIERAAKRGGMGITIQSPTGDIYLSIVKALKTDGYKVKRNSGYDPRDGDSWDNLDISW